MGKNLKGKECGKDGKHQAPKAKIIISKSGELLSYEEYCKQMEEGR